jgi:peptidyl-prolyl isomerase E (cyclophilin E)
MTSSRSKKILFVGNLHCEKVTEELLQAAFIPFGDIKSVSIPRDYTPSSSSSSSSNQGSNGGEKRGYGFVQFESEDDAAAAIDNMNGAELFGRVIEVDIARPLKEFRTRAVWEDSAPPEASETPKH